MAPVSRNRELCRGVGLYGRSQMFKRSGRWLFADKGGPKKEQKIEEKKPASASRYYSAEDAKLPYPSRKKSRKLTKLRPSISAGTVLIILAGRFRGKRVVFLKQLQKSGLLLVTGPYKINGVPIRRVNQAYVIATKTKLDITDLNIPEHIDDSYFDRVNTSPEKDENGVVLLATKVDQEWLEKRKADQKTVDTMVLEKVKAIEDMDKYLGAKFTLTKGQAPHDMIF